MTIAEVLLKRANSNPNAIAYKTDSTPAGPRELTYGELLRRASGIAHELQRSSAIGDRIALLFDPGLDYVCAFLGCLLAGRIAVPAYPPKNNRNGERIAAVVGDAQCSLALVSAVLAPRVTSLLQSSQTQGRTPGCLVTDEFVSGDAAGLDLPDRHQAAFLQYTSGSTSQPKGVVLTHQNLLSNLALLHEALVEGEAQPIGVSWLPPYHDMGLIGGILLPLYSGFPVTLLPPAVFLENPQLWLATISRERATISPSPNFGYQLCADKITDDQAARLNLRTWRFALTGAEKIRRSTLEAFAAKLAPAGFDPTAFFPCYGLAEATLFVTGKSARQSPLSFVPKPTEEGSEGIEDLVGCGFPLRGVDVVIADPDTLMPCPDRALGEIFIRAESVAQGYWNKHEESRRVFNVPVEGTGPCLRTGDLGFLQRGELYIAGRSKELIIIRGRNLFPTDVESLAEAASPHVVKGGVAAFSVDVSSEEKLCVVAEVARSQGCDYAEIAQAIKGAISRMLDVAVHDVRLIKKGTLPRTSSGKTQRFACRDLYKNGGLREVAWEDAAATAQPAAPSSSASDDVERALLSAWSEVFRRPVTLDDDFFDLGGDSLACVNLVAATREKGVQIEYEQVYQWPTVRLLAVEVRSSTLESLPPVSTSASAMPGTLLPVSPQQRRYWKDYLLDIPGPSWSNVFRELEIPGELDLAALRASLDQAVHDHVCLRTGFEPNASGGFQRLHAPYRVEPAVIDLSQGEPSARHALLKKAANELARQVFDLALPPLFKVTAVRLAPGQWKLLFVFHHVVCDAQSLLGLQKEVLSNYAAQVAGTPIAASSPSVNYLDYTRWMHEHYVGSPRYVADQEYWRTTLEGAANRRFLPVRSTAELPDHRGRCFQLKFPATLLKATRAFTAASNVSFFAVVLAALCVQINRITGERDVVIGSPAAGRDVAGTQSLFGLLINLVMLRLRLEPEDTFESLVKRAQREILAALSHQLYQLDDVARDLGVPDENRFPFTTTFLSSIRFDTPCPTWEGKDETVFGLPTDVRFEMMAYLLEYSDGAVLDFKYRVQLFDDAFIRDLALSLVTVIETFGRNSSARLF